MPRTTPKSPVVQSDPTTDNPTDAPAVPGAADTPPAPAPQEDATEAVAVPEPDEHGRYRVRDLDTGHELTIHAAALPHGRYQVLTDRPASDPLTGQPLPPAYAGSPESPVEPTTSGHLAEN